MAVNVDGKVIEVILLFSNDPISIVVMLDGITTDVI